MNIQVGNIIAFKRNPKDPVSFVLGWLLWLLDRDWDRKHWHLAPVIKVSLAGVWVLDAQRGGAKENLYSFDYIAQYCDVFQWLDKPPLEVKAFIKVYKGMPYDFGAYFGTIFFEIIRRVTGRWYRVHDQEVHCWELTCLAMRYWGKPMVDLWEYPLISTIVRNLRLLNGAW